jgi:hypothetical protein
MIYFIRDEQTGFIKIGFTAGDGEHRLRYLQTGCPGNLALLVQIEGSKAEETAWHERFANARERGEWFRATPELMLAITQEQLSLLTAENARLQATLDAEGERLSMARGQLGSLWASLRMDPLPLGAGGLSSPKELPPLEAENARLHAHLDAEEDSRRSLAVAIKSIMNLMERPAVVPVQRAVIFGC